MNGPELPQALLHPKPFTEVREVALGYSNNAFGQGSLIGPMLDLAARKGYWFIEQHFSVLAKILYWPGKIAAQDLARAHRLYQGFAGIRELLRQRKVRYFTSIKHWMDFVAGLDFVFGSRLHGGIMGVQAGVPTYFIVQDARVREICELFHLPFTPEHAVRRDDLEVQRFYEAADYSAAMKVYPERRRLFLDYLRKNGIDQNVAPDGTFLSVNLPEPAPRVLDEAKGGPGIYSRPKDALLDLLFALGERVAQDGASLGLEQAVASCAQCMFDAHRELGQNEGEEARPWS
jgi:hypothetical protein